MERKAYPSDVSDEEWAFVAPYLILMNEVAPQRVHDLREVFNGLRWIIRTGAPWHMLPHDLPLLGRRVSAKPALDACGRIRSDRL